MKGYESIKDHLALLNNRTGVLLSRSGIVDFACFPNFHSEPVFFSILDKDIGGYFKIYPEERNSRSDIYYENETLVARIEYKVGDEPLATTKWFMPMHSEPSIYFSEVYINIESFKDCVFRIEFAPFKKGNREFSKIDGKGIMGKDGKRIMTLVAPGNFTIEKDRATSEIRMKSGQSRWIILSYDLDFPLPIDIFNPDKRLMDTRKYWKNWILKSNYSGIEFENVNRSLLIIKGLFFEPSGFMSASLTTSLPESLGGERNWDYRYMWIRDTSFVVEALIKAGYFDEALRYYLNIIDIIEREGKIYSVYTLDGKKADKEIIIDDLEGYEGSRPVRYGNLAGNQLQIDQYVALIHGLKLIMESGSTPNTHVISKVFKVGEFLNEIWDKPDSSIWEIRGRRRQYTYSKIMAWLGFSDLEYMSNKLGYQDFSNYFKEKKDEVRGFILNNCTFNGKYLSHFAGSDLVDSSLLIVPLVDFMSVEDPIYSSTLEQIESRLLVEKYLFKRYELDDGLKGKDNAFLMISFWYLRNILRKGKIHETVNAINYFKGLFNSSMLLPEELEFHTHKYLGNYPQALSHYSWILLLMEVNEALKN